MSAGADELPRLAFHAMALLQAQAAEPDPWTDCRFAYLRGVSEADECAVTMAADALAVALCAAGFSFRVRGPGVGLLDGQQVEIVVLASRGQLELPGFLPMPETFCRLVLVLRPTNGIELYVVLARPRQREEFIDPPPWMLGGTLEEGIEQLRHELRKEAARRVAKEAEAAP